MNTMVLCNLDNHDGACLSKTDLKVGLNVSMTVDDVCKANHCMSTVNTMCISKFQLSTCIFGLSTKGLKQHNIVHMNVKLL